VIAIEDIAYVRYQAPDLDLAQAFLTDFGMTPALRTPQTLYMRGVGKRSFVHVTELGAPAAVGFGLQARSKDDLQKLAAEIGGRVEDNPEPGGGLCVRLVDPVGFKVEVLWGSAAQQPLAVRAPCLLNVGAASHPRLGHTVRLEPGPSHVLRLGHVVLQVPSFQTSYDFYSRLLGFKTSDSYFVGDPGQTLGAFIHAGLGERYTDHHTIAVFESPTIGIEHSAFEVLDWDDVVLGNAYLHSKQRKHAWGVGRHIQGSQIFDYWRDPFGFKLEHWTDGDQVNDAHLPGHHQFTPETLSQWAPPLPEDFLT